MRLLRFAVLLILSLQIAEIIAKKPKYCGERFAKMRDKVGDTAQKGRRTLFAFPHFSLGLSLARRTAAVSSTAPQHQ